MRLPYATSKQSPLSTKMTGTFHNARASAFRLLGAFFVDTHSLRCLIGTRREGHNIICAALAVCDSAHVSLHRSGSIYFLMEKDRASASGSHTLRRAAPLRQGGGMLPEGGF